MPITHISKEAFVVKAMCEQAHQPFGITVDPIERNLKFVWAFKIDEDTAQREHFDEKRVVGSFSMDSHFPGCPYCGSKNFVVCGNCGGIACYHGQAEVTCPHCGNTGIVTPVDQVSLNGGGL